MNLNLKIRNEELYKYDNDIDNDNDYNLLVDCKEQVKLNEVHSHFSTSHLLVKFKGFTTTSGTSTHDILNDNNEQNTF